jgi:uncharacterized protein
VIVVDTSGVLALLDRDDKHHERLAAEFEESGETWVLPWAILPEVDYLAHKYLGAKVAGAFIDDLGRGAFRVEGLQLSDVKVAAALNRKYPRLHLGLVDGVVMAQAVRLRAAAIVTLDARHFRAVKLELPTRPRLIPLDD